MIGRRAMRQMGVLGCAAVLAFGAAAVLGADSASAGQGAGSPVLSLSARSLPAGQTSTITVSGSDYLVPQHAPGASVFGGVYVMFGWTQPGAWGPSSRNSANNNGVYGVTYSYPGESADAGTRDDGSGTTRLVSFTAGGESGSATAFQMDDNGNWSTTLTIRGSTYQFKDPATGQAKTVNCRQTACGVYTIGAHGKSSVTNERFVPISFVGGAAPPAGPAGPGGATVAPPVAAPSSPTAPAPTNAGTASTLPVTGAGAGATTSTTKAAGGAGSKVDGDERDRKGTETDPIAMTASAADRGGGGGAPGLWLGAIAALLALGVGAFFWVRSRRRRAAPAET